MADDTPYREWLLDHARKPRNFRKIEGAPAVRGHNPLCGDELTLTLVREAGRIADAAFEGVGCALSIASASLMTGALKGLTEAEASALEARLIAAVSGPEPCANTDEALGDLAALASVREFPARWRCVTLAWQTLGEALAGDAPGGDAV